MNLKVCKTCKTEQSIAQFARNKNCADGHLTECKTCNKIYRQLNAEHRRRTAEQLRRSNGVKAKTVFATDGDRKAARTQAAVRWQQRNKERYLTLQKSYRDANKDRRLVLIKSWRQENRALVNAMTAKRRAAVLRAIPSWADMNKINEVYATANQLSQMLGQQYHVDHYYPLQGTDVCGLHVAENLQVLLKRDNLSKSNKHPDEYHN